MFILSQHFRIILKLGSEIHCILYSSERNKIQNYINLIYNTVKETEDISHTFRFSIYRFFFIRVKEMKFWGKLY